MTSASTCARVLATLLASASLGCALDPVEIGRVEVGEDPEAELTAGTEGHDWSEAELLAGVVETISLNVLEVEYVAEVSETLRVVIELRSASGGALPEDLRARMLDDAQQDLASFEASGEGLRLDAALEPGWRVVLSADTPVVLEVHAQVFELP